MKKFRKILKNQRGQGMLEYVLLLAVVAAIVLAFKGTIVQKFQELTGKVSDKADEVIK